MIEIAQDAEQDALIEAAEADALWAREYLEYHLSQLPIPTDSSLIAFLQHNASFEVLIRHDLLAVALVAIGLSNNDGANLREARQQNDRVKHAKLLAKLSKYRLTISTTHMRLSNHVDEVSCEVALPLESARLKDPRLTYTIDLDQISLAVLAGIKTISARDDKISPVKARLYEGHLPISLAYFPDVKSIEMKVGNGVYRLPASAPDDAIDIDQSLDVTHARSFDAKGVARAFRALRACTGSTRDSADQPVWFKDTTAITAGSEAVGRFQSDASLVPELLGLSRKHLDRLGTVFASRFKGAIRCEIQDERLLVSDDLLRCSCPAITNGEWCADYRFDDREDARSYYVKRAPLVDHGHFLRVIDPSKNGDFIELTPINDFQAVLADEDLHSRLRINVSDMLRLRDLTGSQLFMSTRYGPSSGTTMVEMRPFASYPPEEVVAKKVSASHLIGNAAVHSSEFVDLHFLDKRLVIESRRDDEICTYILAYALGI